MFYSVLKANPYRDKSGRYTSKNKATTVTSFGQDIEAQGKWLSDKAKENGAATLDQLIADNPQLFMDLGARWRRYHAFKSMAKILKMNPNHVPAGSPTGGQFAPKTQLTNAINNLFWHPATVAGGLDVKSKNVVGMLQEIASLHSQVLSDDGGSMSMSELKGMFEQQGFGAVATAEAMKKITAHNAANKMWVTAKKNQAVKFAQDGELAHLIANHHDSAAQQLLTQKMNNHYQNFVAAGGDPAVWGGYIDKAMQHAKDIESGAVADTYVPPLGKASKVKGLEVIPETALGKVTDPKPAFNKLVDDVAQAGAAAAGTATYTKFDPAKVTSVKEAWAANHQIGIEYYQKRDKLGQDHPEVQEVYKEWQKTKDYLKENDSSFSSGDAAVKSKNAAQKIKTDAEAAAQHAEYMKQQAHQSVLDEYAGKYAVLHQASMGAKINPKMQQALNDGIDKLNAEVFALKEKGYSPAEISSISGKGHDMATEAHAKTVKSAEDSLTGAMYLKAKLAAKNMETSPEYAQAMLSEKTAKAKLKGLSEEYTSGKMASLTAEAKKKAKADVAAEAAYEKILAGSGSTLQYYDTAKFHEINSKSPPGYLNHIHAQEALLSSAERQVVASYTGSGYKAMNKVVTGGVQGDNNLYSNSDVSSAKHKNTVMEQVMAKMTLGIDMQLRRNAPQKWFWKSFGIDENKMFKLTQEEANNLVVGKTYKEAAFSSTSRNLSFSTTYAHTADVSGAIQYNIRATKNIRGIDVRNISSHDSEKEVILDKNIVYVIRSITRVQSVGASGGGFHWEVNVDAIGHQP